MACVRGDGGCSGFELTSPALVLAIEMNEAVAPLGSEERLQRERGRRWYCGETDWNSDVVVVSGGAWGVTIPKERRV